MPLRHTTRNANAGFTLVELSIVLVVIGLIIGAILVGRELITAAELRATTSQFQKYNSAVNVFKLKYNALPGDMPASSAAAYGFLQLGSSPGIGQGDGNGLVEGFCPTSCPSPPAGCNDSAYFGEGIAFWAHLSAAGLIEGSLGASIVTATGAPAAGILSTTTAFDALLPKAKIGRGLYFQTRSINGSNYFGLKSFGLINTDGSTLNAINGDYLSPTELYNIDIKIDDGVPNTGAVQAAGSTGIYDLASWIAASTALTCTMGGISASDPADTYNLNPASGGNDRSCWMHFRFN